jgi:hypothetical protein
MRLATDPPFCVVPSGSYRQKSGKAVNYYKVLQFKDKRRHYVCSLREDELEKMKSGYPAYKLLNEKGTLCLPAKPKPAKLPKLQQESWSIGFALVDWETEILACVFKRDKRAYVYVKTYNKEEKGKKLKYVGTVPAEKVWHDETELGLFLRNHGYFIIPFSHNAHPRKRKKIISKPVEPPPTANAESEEEWVGYEMEAGDSQAILDRYWDAREFLEACPNDEETARELYGDDQVDEYLGKRKRNVYNRDDDSEDEQP